MAITYPITLPAAPNYSNFTLRAVHATATTQSPFTFKQQVYRHTGARWEASVSLPPMKRDQAGAWKAALTSLRGQQETFYLGNPNYSTPRGTLRSTDADIQCAATGTANQETLTLDFNVATKTLLAGDYIQIGSGADAQLYMILEDITGDGSVEVFPRLRASYVNATVITNSAVGVFRLQSNIVEYGWDNLETYGLQFDAVEAI